MNLLTKSILYILTLGLIIIVITTVFSAQFVTKILQEKISEKQVLIAQDTMDKIDRILFVDYQNISTIANAEDIAAYVKEGKLIKSDAIQRSFTNYNDSTGPWDILSIIDKNGTIILTTNITEIPGQKNKEKEEITAFNEAIKGQTYYSDVVISTTTHKPTLIFASPIRDHTTSQEAVIGVVIGQISWSVIEEAVYDANSPQIHLYNSDSQIIADYKPNEGEKLLSTSYKNFPALQNALHNNNQSTIIANSVDSNEKDLVSSVSEQGYLSYIGNHWLLTVQTPTTIAFAPVQQNILILSLLMIGIITIFTLLILFYVINYLVRPIKSLNQTTKLITDGDFSIRAPIYSHDELGIVSQSFNQMVDKLVDLREKDKAILSNMGDGVFVIDNDERIILFNEAATEITGFTHEDTVGKPYKQVLQFSLEKDNTPKDDFIREALTGKKAEMANHTVVKHKKGHTVPVADSASPIFDNNGKVQGVVVVFRNVTKERELIKMKDDFLSTASHELRTPMTAIKGFISMILQGYYGPVNTELNEPLNDIYSATQRLIHLVNDLLNVSRIESGRLTLTLSDEPLSDCINEVTKILGPLLDQKKLSIGNSIDTSIVVQIDKDKLQEVFNNLIGNALKFTDKGGITISCKKEIDNIVIYVTDTGTGIRPEDQQKLFNKFQQIYTEQKDRPIGTGLGLYISRQLVRLMGGYLWLEKSEYGKGSTFALTIPLSQTELAKTVKIAAEKLKKV